MIRKDCLQAFWKELKRFTKRVRITVKNQNNDKIPYAILTYGKIVNYINKEGLVLWYETLKWKSWSWQELGSFFNKMISKILNET